MRILSAYALDTNERILDHHGGGSLFDDDLDSGGILMRREEAAAIGERWNAIVDAMTAAGIPHDTLSVCAVVFGAPDAARSSEPGGAASADRLWPPNAEGWLVMKVVCRDCRHPQEVHDVNGKGECACGCVRLVPIDRAAREARKRTYLVEVKFFVKNRWIQSGQLRVKAMAVGGAAALGIRQAKREHLKPRTRVGQTVVQVTPIRGGSR